MKDAKRSIATTNQNNDTPVHIVGAGIAGLTAALGFARRSFRVSVYEQTAEFGEVGAGIQISPNGVAVLDALGLGDRLRGMGTQLVSVELHDGLNGKRVASIPLKGVRPYLAVHRADLIEILADAISEHNVKVAFNTVVKSRFADGLTVAADGIHSVFRQQLGQVQKPKYTGHVAWRAVVEGTKAISSGARIDMAPGMHVVSYPIRGGRETNIVAVEERATWLADGWSHQGDIAELRRRFAPFGTYVQDLLERVEKVGVWGLHKYPMAEGWHNGKGLVMIGDAAHPTLPFMAQGANLAIEDAWELSDRTDPADLGASLARFQARRQERVRRALYAADRNARNYHLRNPVVRGIAHAGLNVVSRFAPGALSGKFDWLYGFDVTARAND